MTTIRALVSTHRGKLDQAARHLNALDGEIKALLAKNPYQCMSRIDPISGEHVWNLKVLQDLPQSFSALFGDCTSNMRSSLDHLTYALAVAHVGTPRQPKRIQFPIDTKQSDFDGHRKTWLGEVSPQAQDIIETLQPYNDPDPDTNNLFVLSELSGVDKHRHFHLIQSVMTGVGVEINQVGPTYQAPHMHTPAMHRGPFLDGQELMRVKIPDGIEIRFKIPYEIALVSGGKANGLSVITLLKHLGDYIIGEVFPKLEACL